MTRGRTGAALAALLLLAACGKLGPPVRASQAREPAAADLPAGEGAPADRADDEREGKK